MDPVDGDILKAGEFASYVVIDSYLTMLKQELPEIKKREKKAAKEGFKSMRERGFNIPDLTDEELEIGVGTRLITDAALVGVWGYYEMAVDRVADFLMRSRGLTLPRRAVKGDFLDSAKRYFSGALGCELHPITKAEWERLRLIETLRHQIAHSTGSLYDKSNEEKESIAKLLKKVPGVTVYPGRIAISLEFVQDAFAFVRALILNLTERAKTQAIEENS